MTLSKDEQLMMYRKEIEYLTAEIEDLQREIDRIMKQSH